MCWQQTSLLIFSAFLISSCYKSIYLTFEEIKKKKGRSEPAMSVSPTYLSTIVPLRLHTFDLKMQDLYLMLRTLEQNWDLYRHSLLCTVKSPTQPEVKRVCVTVARMQHMEPKYLSSILIPNYCISSVYS